MGRILVIEDEPGMRDAMEKILARAGHQVSLASNGKEGLARAAAAPPDLVVTDVFMPEKDGIETTIALRKSHPNIKIIAISGGGRSSNFDFLEIAKNMGANATLQKPLRMAELLDQVNRLLGATR